MFGKTLILLAYKDVVGNLTASEHTTDFAAFG
jgi:hypothetical protein